MGIDLRVGRGAQQGGAAGADEVAGAVPERARRAEAYRRRHFPTAAEADGGTAVRDVPREGIDFFPLPVDYREKMNAAGTVPGGFRKREGGRAGSKKSVLILSLNRF